SRWLYLKITGKEAGDNSFRLAKSITPEAETRGSVVTEILFVIAFIVWIGLITPGNFITRTSLIVGSVVAILLGTFICIALCEIGHIGAAWCVNMKLQRIQVGVGPVVWSHRSNNGLVWVL